MAINWDELESRYSFKKVENGKYEATVIKAEVSDTPGLSGGYAVNFELRELDGKPFPYSSSHWLSFKEGGDGWRQHHMKCLLTDMRVDEAKARQKIEECENAGTKDQIVDAYRKMFNALARTMPKANVVVETQAYKHKNKDTGVETLRPDGRRTEFDGDSYMPPQTLEGLKKRWPDVPVADEFQDGTKDDTKDDNHSNTVEILGGEPADDISVDDIPF